MNASKLRLTRELVDLLPQKIEDPGPLKEVEDRATDEFYETTVKAVLSALPPGEDLWVFAFGSLIWNPRFNVMETRSAMVSGWHRAFCLGPDTRYRGNPQNPGLMLSLDQGGTCEGVVMRMSVKTAAQELPDLLRSEPPFAPVWLDATTANGDLRAMSFVTKRGEPGFVDHHSRAEAAQILSTAVGMLGSMPDYILNTIENLKSHGIHDSYLWDMANLVAEQLEQLRDGKGTD